MPAPLQTSYLIVQIIEPLNHLTTTGTSHSGKDWLSHSVSGVAASSLRPSNQWVWRHSKARTAPWWPQSMGQPEALLHGSSQLGLNCSFLLCSIPCLVLSITHPHTQRVNVEQTLSSTQLWESHGLGKKGKFTPAEWGWGAGMGNWPEDKTP